MKAKMTITIEVTGSTEAEILQKLMLKNYQVSGDVAFRSTASESVRSLPSNFRINDVHGNMEYKLITE